LWLVVYATGFISGCATNPVTGTPDLVFMSEAEEIQLGRTNDAKIKKQYPVYENAVLQAYVDRVGQQLAKHSHRPSLTYHFTVLDSPEVNAFALPGGYVYITRGILAYLNSEAELAAVLGHEIGHVTARHAVRQHSAATTTGILGSIIGAATGTQNLFNDTFGHAFLSGYGRDHELESDRLGAEYLARSGYNPQAMLEVIGVLKNQEEFEKKLAAAENRPPRIYHGVFASHPSADKRLQEVVAQADQFKSLDAPVTQRADYLTHINGIAFGDSVNEGIRRGSLFYHRDLNLVLTFPSGWSVKNYPDAIASWPKEKNALLVVKKRLPPGESISLDSFVKQQLKLGNDFHSQPIPELKWPSLTGTETKSVLFSKREIRVSAVHYGPNIYFFLGDAKDTDTFKRVDADFVATAASLRALKPTEKKLSEGLHIRTVRARKGDRYTELAKKSPLIDNREENLRLINGHFPDGEPVPGDWIKVVE